MKLLVIANPHAASGRERADAAFSCLKDAGHEPEEMPESLQKEGRHEDLVQACTGYDAVVLVGGDGTLNWYLQLLMDAGKPVMFLPSGTANDFANTLGLPLELRDWLPLLESGHRKAVDVGVANGKPFINVAHIGFAAEAKKSLTDDSKRSLGGFAYLWSALKTLGIKGFTTRVRYWRDTEGEAKQLRLRSEQLSIGNSGAFGGGWRISETANPLSGKLDLVSVAPGSLWQKCVQFILVLMRRQTEHEQVTHLRGKRFEIATSRKLEMTADGEWLGETPVTFTLREGAIHFFCPEQGTSQ